ncbi:hypothetical protein CMV_011642, partial [Castanea mollissima]
LKHQFNPWRQTPVIKSHNPWQASKSHDPRQQTQAGKTSPSNSAIATVAFKICHRHRHLQNLTSPSSPSSSAIAAIIFKLCHCLQASPLSETTEMGERGKINIFGLGRKQQGEERREKKKVEGQR